MKDKYLLKTLRKTDKIDCNKKLIMSRLLAYKLPILVDQAGYSLFISIIIVATGVGLDSKYLQNVDHIIQHIA